MKINTFAVATFVVVSMPLAAFAQGTIRGAEDGAAAGNSAAGPAGAVVGGAVGAATGTVGAILGVDDRPRFREYVIHEHRPSFRYRERLRVGAILPEHEEVAFYPVPPEYHLRADYRYAIVNDYPVIVDPRTRRIVEIID